MADRKEEAEKQSRPKAFLRWIGGKRLMVRRLLQYLPSNIGSLTYHEPFVGAANLFFSIDPAKATLSDLNSHLVESYREVRENPARVAAYLRDHKHRNKEIYYYKVRDYYNRASTGPAQAARFIYLNHTCFNGIFRVNQQGAFNVPYGDKANPQIPDSYQLKRASEALQKASLRVADYEDSLAAVKPGEFVYLDPPYPPLNGTSFFTHYTADRFSDKDQARLAECVRELHRIGALFLMTNADLPAIRRLYRGFGVRALSVTRYVSCKGSPYRVSELVVTNHLPRKT